MLGFDATLQFEPQLGVNRGFLEDGPGLRRLVDNLRLGVASSQLKLYGDAESRRRMRARPLPHPVYPSVYVSWDNSPRRGKNGIIFVNGSPKNFEAALRSAIDCTRLLPADERFVFINAWNEWAEGNHLEPDQRYGNAYLAAVARTVAGTVARVPAAGERHREVSDGGTERWGPRGAPD